MIMCVFLCYPVSFHMLQLLLTGHPISSFTKGLDPGLRLKSETFWNLRIFGNILLVS